MIIKRMVLENFRQFEGKQEINFTTSEDKNIIVILGNNGSGKTTLNQAFLFCLYGIQKVKFNDFEGSILDKNKSASVRKLCNHLAFKRGEKNIRVGVRTLFEHNEIEYDIYRYYDFQWSKVKNEYIILFENFEDSKKTQIGINSGVAQVRESELRNILPEALSPMFFFDGERMEKLASDESKNVLSNAVINILDLLPFRVALSRLKSKEQIGINTSSARTVESILRKELKQTVTDDIDYAEEIDKLEYKKVDLINGRNTAKEKHSSLRIKADELLEEIKKLSANKTEQEKRQQLIQENRAIEKNLEDNQKTVIDNFSEKFSGVLVKEHSDLISNIIQNSIAKDRDIKGINAIAIDILVNRKQCLCGTDLSDGTIARKKLLEWKEFLPPKDLSTLLIGIKDGMNSQIEEGEKFEDTFKRLKDSSLRMRQKLMLNQEKIDLIRENNMAIEQCKILEEELRTITYSEASVRSRINTYDSDIKNIDSEIEVFKRKLKETTISVGLNEKVNKKISLLDRIYDMILNSSEKKESIAKNQLAELSSINYQDIEQKDYELVLNEDYSFDILNSSKQSVTAALSEGEKVVASFSFIGALVKTAKELNKKIQEEGSQEYPLVMDAPFAKLDIEHRENVAKKLPEFSSQVIIFSADSQWEGIIKDTLSPKISSIYKLVFDKQLETTKVYKEEIV